jgi:hypothetical protein
MQWEATGSRADIKWNTKSCLVLSTELNKQSCTQTSLSILSVYPRSALLCFTCINRLSKLFEDKHHISVYKQEINLLQTRFIPAMHRGWSWMFSSQGCWTRACKFQQLSHHQAFVQ